MLGILAGRKLRPTFETSHRATFRSSDLLFYISILSLKRLARYKIAKVDVQIKLHHRFHRPILLDKRTYI